jgi:hypothetical protein
MLNTNLFLEKSLAGVHQQIRYLIQDASLDWLDQGLSLARMCFAPWEVAEIFGLPSTDPTSVVDRYSLRALTDVDLHLCDPPGVPGSFEDEPWATDLISVGSVPMFSPLEVWKAAQRWEEGDVGIQPPPISGRTDRLLRNINRGYESAEFCAQQLAEEAHDVFVLSAALKSGDPQTRLDEIELVARDQRLWRIQVRLSGESAERYLRSYLATVLAEVREVFNMAIKDRQALVADWVSPSIIQCIEQHEVFQESIRQPPWLYYKAATVVKGKLPEVEHNRMLAEAIGGDVYAKAYLRLPFGTNPSQQSLQ